MDGYVEDKPLSEIFNIRADDYKDISTFLLPFSVRVLNRFKYHHINTVQDLLLLNISFLKSIQGFGTSSLSQVLAYCKELSSPSVYEKTKNPIPSSNIFFKYKDSIALGDFSFVNTMNLSEEEEEQLAIIKEAYEILGEELAFECICSPEKIRPMISALSTFVTRNSRLRMLKRIYYKIPAFRRNNCAKYYINTFSYDEDTRSKLVQCYGSVDDELSTIMDTIDADDDTQVRLAERFLEWCSFDLTEEIRQLFAFIYSTNRIQIVMEGRANGLTLNELGEQLGVTRERIRQIELKTKRQFGLQQTKIKIMSKLHADLNGQSIISLEDIESVSGDNAATLIYLLKDIKGSLFAYDHQLEVFVFGDNDLSSRIQDFIDTLPNILHKKNISKVLKTAQEEYDLEKEYVEKALFDVYKVTGDVFHRTTLTLAKIYDSILRKYYVNGIHIYDDNEIESLRQHILNDYGNISLPSSNRAIAARISSICVLAGRGVYIPKKDHWITEDLAQKILAFIMNSSSPVLLIGSVFSIFEEELESQGIGNKYFLQGVLRELFDEKLYFRKDYVSRDKGFTSIYSSIISFIKESKYPVKKEELKEKYKGITDVVIALATSDSDILNLYGEYLHASNLAIRTSEKTFLSERLATIISDSEVHHIKDIFSAINNERPEIFSRNAVLWPYGAFSVLEYLFKDQYQFSRPYIALHNVEIGRPNERLQDYLYSMDEFSISEITDFAKENHMQIPALIEYINSLNDKFLLLNVDTLSSIDEIGINSLLASEVESLICDEITETIPIRDLQCISKLPQINVPWNEWLIYSVLKKWSTKLDVALSSNQLRQSIPLVSVAGDMDSSKYKDVSPAPVQIKIDNMDDIDSILADILSDELLEETE